MAQDADIILNRPTAYWFCIRRISRPERSLGHVRYLRCSQAHIILGVPSGTTSPKAIGRESIRWHGTISETAGKYPQESYSAVICAIQSEWIFLQLITWYTGGALAGVEKIIRKPFCLVFFFWNTKTLSPIVGTLSMMPIKVARLGLLNPVKS